jgi:PAS domain S-box-containing protein
MGITSNKDSRKKPDILLRDQSGFLTSIINTVGALIVVLDSKGRIVCFNRACEKTTGYSFEEVNGRAVWDFLLLPEEIEPVKNVFKQLRAGDFPNQYENAWIMKDGSRRLFSWSNTALVEEGTVEYVIATGIDITERKRTEDALRSSEERFRTLVDQSPFSIQILSTDGRTVRVNRAWEELWGTTPKMLEGYNILEDKQLVENGLMPFIQKGFAGIASEIPAAEYDPQKTISGGGPKRWVRGFIYPVNSNGKITEIVLMHEDVTKQKQAERRLKESEEKFRTIFESSNDAIILFNENNFFDCNSAALKMFGYDSREDFFKNHPADISPSTQPGGRDSRQAANENIATAFRDGHVFFEWTHRRITGQEFPAEVLLTPLELDGKPVMQGTVRDMTTRKRLEESLRFLVETTSAVTGRDFFRLLVRELANVLGMRYALVGALIPGVQEQIQTTAVWAQDGYLADFIYDLAFTLVHRYSIIAAMPWVFFRSCTISH